MGVHTFIERGIKAFKLPFKVKEFPLPISFVTIKNDSLVTDEQMKEIKTRYGNLSYKFIKGVPFTQYVMIFAERFFSIYFHSLL